MAHIMWSLSATADQHVYKSKEYTFSAIAFTSPKKQTSWTSALSYKYAVGEKG
jgi:hypothetical protein